VFSILLSLAGVAVPVAAGVLAVTVPRYLVKILAEAVVLSQRCL
jgi:hypothetical protein